MSTPYENRGNLGDLASLALEQSASLKRTASRYVATMVDVVSQINGQAINRLEGVDFQEIRQQTGQLVYFTFKGVEQAVPIDIEFIPRLYCHLRRPCLLLLKKEKQWLSAAHRRIYSKLEKEHQLEKHFNPDADSFVMKMQNTFREVDRYKSMVELVVGGGRKLDILNHAQNVFSQAKFEIFFRERSLLDPYHPRHATIQKWLKNSQHQGSIESFRADLAQWEQRLLDRCKWIFDLQESLTGIQLPLDNDHPDLSRTWYHLGQAVGRGEEFMEPLVRSPQLEDRLKRTSFVAIRKDWDALNLRHALESMRLAEMEPQARATAVAKLILDISTLMQAGQHEDGDAFQAVAADLAHGVLTEKEAKEACNWIASNQMRLSHVLAEAGQLLTSLSEQDPGLLIPADVSAQLSGQAMPEEASPDLQQGENEAQILAKVAAWASTSQESMDSTWQEGLRLHQALSEKMQRVSLLNVGYHEELRQTFADASKYEAHVLELMQQTQSWRQEQVRIENRLVELFRGGPLADISEPILQSVLSVIHERMLRALRKLDYAAILANGFEAAAAACASLEPQEALTRYDYLFQEIQLIPQASLLVAALQDWQKTLPAHDLADKQTLLEENEQKLAVLAGQLRNEMRELLAKVPTCSRRLRFQVFGLGLYHAGSLERTRHLLMTILGKCTQMDEFRCLFQSLKDLESQLLQAQTETRKDGGAHLKLKELVRSGQIPREVLVTLETDLKENYRELDALIARIGKDMQQVAEWRVRLGEENQFDYLNISVNADDLEALNKQYQFAESAELEQIRRFCLAYQYKANMTADLFARARKGDPNLPAELQQELDKKVIQAFFEERSIPPTVKLQLFIHLPEHFEAEVQLLLHTLNLVQPAQIRDKATYRSMIQALCAYQNRPPGLKRKSTVLFGRLQNRLYAYRPAALKANFESNRSALFTDLQESSAGEFRKPQ